MDYLESLNLIVQDIIVRLDTIRKLRYNEELKICIKSLDSYQKAILCSKICQLQWNIGFPSILVFLQECGILTASEYIIYQEDKEYVQLILNDILETEPSLLANMINNSTFDFKNSVKLNSMLKVCFSHLINDLKKDPNAVNFNYLRELKKFLTQELLFATKINHLHSLMDNEMVCVKEAFLQQPHWKILYTKDSFMWDFLQEVLTENKIIDELLNIIAKPKFKGWHILFTLFHVLAIIPNEYIVPTLKNNLKQQLKNFLDCNDEEILLKLFLLARIIHESQIPNMDSYANWFKNTFGDIKYTVNVMQFKVIMNALQNMIEMETSEKYLKIQANTSISPPAMCNEIVLTYKQICKSKLLLLPP